MLVAIDVDIIGDAGAYITNSKGQRIAEIEKSKIQELDKIFFIGDSFTFGHLSNYEKMHTINWRLMYLNVKGTKDGPGRKSPDVLPLTCTPILDEEDKPIEGTRLDWIKQGFDGLSGDFKNFLPIIFWSQIEERNFFVVFF